MAEVKVQYANLGHLTRVFVTLLSRRDHHLSCHLGEQMRIYLTYCLMSPDIVSRMSYKSVCEVV
jgi:hypothetical protein